MTLLERLQRVYMAHTGKATPHGCYLWLAEQVPCSERTVRRAIKGKVEPRSPVVERLAELEQAVPSG